LVKIRLRRIGRKKLPIYQLVATDARERRDGKFIEDLGRYEPTKRPHSVMLKEDRVAYWLGVGAQPTSTARSVISGTGLLLKLYLKKKGKSEDEVNAEMEKWAKKRAEGLKRRLARKSIRRKAKKDAEAKAKEAKEAPAA
jgi:small subunit ribosomal protein S16